MMCPSYPFASFQISILLSISVKLQVISVVKRKGRPTELALSVGSYSNLSQCKYTKNCINIQVVCGKKACAYNIYTISVKIAFFIKIKKINKYRNSLAVISLLQGYFCFYLYFLPATFSSVAMNVSSIKLSLKVGRKTSSGSAFLSAVSMMIRRPISRAYLSSMILMIHSSITISVYSSFFAGRSSLIKLYSCVSSALFMLDIRKCSARSASVMPYVS